MNQANSQAVTSTTGSTTSGSILAASIDGSNSGQGLADTATITNAIKGAQMQQQVALVYFQLINGQNVQGQVSQIINVDVAAAFSLPGASTVDVQDVAELQPANAIQQKDFGVSCLQDIKVHDVQEQQIISNDRTLHRREISPNALAALCVTSTPSHQQMPLFSLIQTVDAGAQESSQLQKDSNDTEKWQVLVSATNPATVSTPLQHSQVSESVTPNLAIAATSTTSTSAESQSSYSVLNAPRLKKRKQPCPCPNCNDQDGRNKKSKKKEHPCHAPGCTKVYCKTSHLRAHYRWHTGERPFVCSWASCGKKFIRSDGLKRHLRTQTHTGEKNFQCSECFQRFSRKDHLSKHFKTYHNKGS